MNEHFLREGFSSYYVVKKEREYPYEEKILSDQKCGSVLPFEIRRVDEESYYYFNISGYCSLKQVMSDQKNSVDEYRKMYQKIFEAVSEVEGYLLPPEGILMQSENIFFKDQEQNICFCYLPGRNKDLVQQLLDLTEEFLEIINYEDKKLVQFLYQTHEQISNGTIPEFDEKKEEKDCENETELYFDDTEGLWEEEEEMFFRGKIKVKRSGKWYTQIGFFCIISFVLVCIIAYELYGIYAYGWNANKGKYLTIFVIIFIANIFYLIRKIKINRVPEKFTTILTEEESIDKIGES